ncbi:GNAT family N-acetyltransferase [Streptomyces sp. MS06]|uniref:GNAT family N-acetyltransferase n=1 Tax=Streptomyces sp. MS06 TaxID=3385974 RepID=UPI0039A0C9BE
MAVKREFAGAGVGGTLLDWASERAATQGKQWLRLDAWKDNQGLHRFYKNAGFTLVRVVDLPHRRSGALFQRATGHVL